MKTITIYPTVVNIPENINIDTLIAIPGFEEILDVDISPERFKELVEALSAEGISVKSVVIPDGLMDENTINKEQFKELLDIARNCDNTTYGIIFCQASAAGMCYEDFMLMPFQEQLDVLVSSNMLSNRASLEVSNHHRLFSALNAYEIMIKLTLHQPEFNIFNDFKENQKFSNVYKAEIDNFKTDPSDENKKHLVQLYMKFFKGGCNPEQAIRVINVL